MENKNGHWIYESHSWAIPRENETGVIQINSVENSTGLNDTLGLLKDSKKVIMIKLKQNHLSENPKWTRKPEKNGFFRLENQGSVGGFLTAEGFGSLKIEGN